MAAKKTKKAQAQPAAQGPATLNDVVRGFLAWLEREDAGHGTLASYGMELKIALRELGSETAVGDLTVERVQAYFEGAAVTRTRSGKPKAKSSIAKTKRVFRQAMLWAQDEKLVEVAPLPKAASLVAVAPESI